MNIRDNVNTKGREAKMEGSTDESVKIVRAVLLLCEHWECRVLFPGDALSTRLDLPNQTTVSIRGDNK